MFTGLLCTQNFKRSCDVHESLYAVRLPADSRRQNHVCSKDLAAIRREQFGYVFANDVGL